MALLVNVTLTASQPRAIVVNFHGWDGWVPGLKARAERFTRVGQTGSGTQITGREGEEADCRFWAAFTSEDTMLTFLADLEALVGYPVKMVGQYRDFDTVTVRAVSIAVAKPCRGPAVTGTSRATHRVEGTIRIEVQP